MSLLLRPLAVTDEPAARRAHAELAEEGFAFLLDQRDGEPWAAYVARLHDLDRGVGVPADRVPATFLVAEVDGELVGRVSVRHELNPYLARVGGHVGYAVRRGARRRGHATAMLLRGLDLLRGRGVARALVTCADDNVGSATVVERCGGVLQDVVDDEGVDRRRYWVDLAQARPRD